VGGKLLTNQLKRVLSFRQWDLAAETHVVNRIREQCCYVTMDWKKDMDMSRFVTSDDTGFNRIILIFDKQTSRLPKSTNPVVQEYCLPDFTPYNPKGYIKSGPSATTPPERPVLDDAGLQNQIMAEDEHVVKMNNERFSVPEIIFTPSDIGQCNPSHLIAMGIDIVA
jgi:actin-related protein 6